MGYNGKLKEKETAISLRKQGFSYREIYQKVGVSKDTISRWCRDVLLTQDQINKLILNKENGLRKGSVIGALANKKKRIKSEIIFINKGIKDIGKLTKRDRFLVGVALYFAEGSKTNSSIEFTNSDPESIIFMVKWLYEFLNIKPRDLHFALWLHDNLNENIAKNYWSKLLNISTTQFNKTYFAKNKILSKKIRKNIHSYGIIKIRYYNIQKFRLIKGWIKGIFCNLP